MTPWLAFLTGLTTGGLTCMAVQGGLLAGILARRSAAADGRWQWANALVPTASFLVAKLFVYLVLGGLLGWLGSRMQLSTTVQLWFQAVAALFIIVAGLRLRWPNFLPWLTPQLPAAGRRFIRRSAKWESVAAPAAVGFLTVLIPCGTTQAMEVSAIGTGSAATGAAILGAFVLGTVPLFLLVGVAARSVAVFQKQLATVAMLVVVGVGLVSLNGVLVATDSPLSAQNQLAAWRWALTGRATPTEIAATDIAIDVHADGYTPNAVTVPAGRVVTFNLTTEKNSGCTSVFRIPKLGISKNLPTSGTSQITAQFPSAGRYTFTCGMGMYSGTVNVI